MNKELSANTNLSHYRIVSKIGAGGMGEVYLAEDTRLDRKVAIKFLNQELSKDADKLNRFIQEAKAASALNHPNILTVFEIGEADGTNYIVTELIDGKTLREQLSQKEPVPISDLNFSGVTVRSRADFSNSTFNEFADFSATEFEVAADFGECTFNGVTLFWTGFGGDIDFSGVDFAEHVDFNHSEFKASANFIGTVFHNSVDFTDATFDHDVSLDLAVFKDSSRFGRPDGGREAFGDKARLSLGDARIDKPERFSFHSMRLKPSWFLNVDIRKFDFTNVTWFQTGIDEDFSVFGPVHKLLAITYRQLAINAEENHRYREASHFRYLAMDVQRFERTSASRIRWPKIAFWRLSWWYWLASGYGERVLRAVVGLIGIWVLFGLLYSQVGFARWEPKVTSESEAAKANYDISGAPLPLSRALVYSAGVMTLQKPEPKPSTVGARSAVLLETILGPLQAALLALAIRRKFIR